jgi:hypothetical protein
MLGPEGGESFGGTGVGDPGGGLGGGFGSGRTRRDFRELIQAARTVPTSPIKATSTPSDIQPISLDNLANCALIVDPGPIPSQLNSCTPQPHLWLEGCTRGQEPFSRSRWPCRSLDDAGLCPPPFWPWRLGSFFVAFGSPARAVGDVTGGGLPAWTLGGRPRLRSGAGPGASRKAVQSTPRAFARATTVGQLGT